MKVKCDHRSKFSNLSNWKEEAWKKSGLQRDSNPWPPRYRCDALPTELWSHTLGARSMYWSNGDLAPNVWLHSSVGRASHRYRGGHGFESREAVIFFRLLLSSCLNWKIYCDDHTSLSKLWIFSILTGQQKRDISYRLLLYITTEFHYGNVTLLAWFVIREVYLPIKRKIPWPFKRIFAHVKRVFNQR